MKRPVLSKDYGSQNFRDGRNLENVLVQPPNFTDEETKAQERQTDLLKVTTPNQWPG